MDKALRHTMIKGYFFTSVIGTIMHFVYQLSGKNAFVGLIASVNESPWEHLKLLFFPFLGFIVFMSVRLGGKGMNVQLSGYVSVMLGMWSILSVYYTFNGMLGGNNDVVNILSYFIGTGIAFITMYFTLQKTKYCTFLNVAGGAMLCITTLFFFVFTYYPPMLPLFSD